MEYRDEMICHYNDLEEYELVYESESTGDQFYVAQRIRNADAGGNYFSIMCYEPRTGRNYWMRAPRRATQAEATNDLIRMAKRPESDWGEIIA